MWRVCYQGGQPRLVKHESPKLSVLVALNSTKTWMKSFKSDTAYFGLIGKVVELDFHVDAA